jgi:hypothetical protein
VAQFDLQEEDTRQIAGYVEGLKKEYPEASFSQFVIYCFGNKGFRVKKIRFFQKIGFLTERLCQKIRFFQKIGFLAERLCQKNPIFSKNRIFNGASMPKKSDSSLVMDKFYLKINKLSLT